MREAMNEVLAEREREKEERETKGRDASSVRRWKRRLSLPFVDETTVSIS